MSRGCLEIDGRDVTAECDRFDMAMPRLVYDEDNGTSMVRFLGPLGFQLTLVNPSDRLRALADGGATVHAVKISSDGVSITHAVQFHREWDCTDGTRKVFGSLAMDRGAEAKWIPEADRSVLVN